MSLQNKVLMPDPHTESGSQDLVIVPAQESLVSLHDVTALRFILRQPSPNWKTFNIEDIAVRNQNKYQTILLVLAVLFTFRLFSGFSRPID